MKSNMNYKKQRRKNEKRMKHIWKKFRQSCIKHNRLVKRGKRKSIVEPFHLLVLILAVPISSFITILLINLLYCWKIDGFLFNWHIFFDFCKIMSAVYTIYAIYIWRR